MIHRRGFSFTDDSAGVTSSLPSSRRDGPSGSKQIFMHNLEAAKELQCLRQFQSHAYQSLFQSERLSSEEAWPLMSSVLDDMHRWSDSLPDRLPDPSMRPIRNLFHADVLYSSVLILSPPDLIDTLCDYGKFLIFEYTTEYATLMVSISRDHERSAFSSYHDALAVSFVAESLTYMLYSYSRVLFRDTVPQAPMNSVPPLGPATIPARTVGERINRAYGCLTQLEETMEYLGPRYGYCEPLNNFRSRCDGIRRELQAIYDNWNQHLGVSRSQYVSPGVAVNGMRH